MIYTFLLFARNLFSIEILYRIIQLLSPISYVTALLKKKTHQLYTYDWIAYHEIKSILRETERKKNVCPKEFLIFYIIVAATKILVIIILTSFNKTPLVELI